MKKYILLLLPFLIWGCEKKYDNVVEVQSSHAQTVFVASVDSFLYVKGDSAFTAQLKIQSKENVKNVFFDVFSPDMDQLNSSPVEMFDNGSSSAGDAAKGDLIYSNKFPLSRQYPNGKYTIKYYLTNSLNKTFQVAEESFKYNNGQSNVAPVISNLIMPDTIKVGEQFKFSVEVKDSNGYNDIATVYYELFKPDGSIVTNSQGLSKFPLVDNGTSGDAVPGDGKFTMSFEWGGNIPGAWRFDIHAVDRSKAVSNLISHNVVVSQ